MILSFFIYYFEKGPILPPFPKDFASVDCNFLQVLSVNNESDLIKFNLAFDDIIEFTPEYLANFVSIRFHFGNLFVYYSAENYTYSNLVDKSLEINVNFSFEGFSEVESFCLNRRLFNDRIFVKLPDYMDAERSYAPYAYGDTLYYKNSCLEYGKFLYFSKLKGDMPNIPFNNGSLRFEFLNMQLADYLKQKDLTLVKKFSYYVPDLPKENWKKVYFWLVPIYCSIENHSKDDDIIVLFQNDPNKEQESLLKLNRKNIHVQKIDKMMCWEDFIIPNISDYQTINNESLFTVLNNYDFKKINLSREEVSNTIVLAEECDFVNKVSNELTDYTVVYLKKDMDLTEQIKHVSSCKIFVSSHISSLVLALFLSSDSVLIDASSGEYTNIKFFEAFKSRLTCKVHTINTNRKSNCTDIECYLINKDPMLFRPDVSYVIKAIKMFV